MCLLLTMFSFGLAVCLCTTHKAGQWDTCWKKPNWDGSSVCAEYMSKEFKHSHLCKTHWFSITSITSAKAKAAYLIKRLYTNGWNPRALTYIETVGGSMGNLHRKWVCDISQVFFRSRVDTVHYVSYTEKCALLLLSVSFIVCSQMYQICFVIKV